VDMLSSPGNYAYQIKGLGNLLAEGSNDVDVIRGEVNVTQSTGANNIDIDGINLSFDSPVGGARDYDLVLSSQNDGQGDNFYGVALDTGDVILATDVNAIGTATFAPSVSIELGSAIDTGATPLNQRLSIEILEIDGTLNATQDGPNTRDVGERKVEVQFDLKREGDGTEEVWSSIPNSNMTVNVWEASAGSNASPSSTFTLSNSDADVFTMIENTSSTTSSTLGIKLDDILRSVENQMGSSFPTAVQGDEFMLTISFVDNNNHDMIASGEFILS